MQIYPVEEAQAQFAELMDRALAGERIGVEKDDIVFVLNGSRDDQGFEHVRIDRA